MYVSYAAFDIYRDGGFVEPTEMLATLKQDSQGVFLSPDEIFPPFSYYRPSFGFACQSESFAREVSALAVRVNGEFDTGPAATLACLPRALIGRDLIYLRGQDGAALLYETHRPNDRDGVVPYDAAALADPGDTLHAGPDDTLLFLGGYGSADYALWLVDHLPRLAAARNLIARHGGRLVVLLTQGGAQIDALRRQSIETVLGQALPHDIRFIAPDRLYAADRLHYVSPVSYHPVSKSPHALAFLREAVERHLPNLRAAVRHKLYAYSGSDPTQSITNGAALLSYLRGEGFLVVDLDPLTFHEQAALFRDAELVVGPMQAGMANTVFCRSGTPLIYLAPEGWAEPFFWDLASSCRHGYAVCYGRPEGERDGAVRYEVDISTLIDALAQPA